MPGCPPTPEALIFGLLKMHEKVDRQSIVSVPLVSKRLVPICAGSPAGPGRFRPAPGGVDQRYDAEGSDRRVVAIRQRGRRQRNRARPARRRHCPTRPKPAWKKQRDAGAPRKGCRNEPVVNCQLPATSLHRPLATDHWKLTTIMTQAPAVAEAPANDLALPWLLTTGY